MGVFVTVRENREPQVAQGNSGIREEKIEEYGDDISVIRRGEEEIGGGGGGRCMVRFVVEV